MQITKDILTVLKSKHNCRFIKLKKYPDGSEWEEISDQKARDKISHALRYAKNGQMHVEDNSYDGNSSSVTSGSKKGKSRVSIVRTIRHGKCHRDSTIKYSTSSSVHTGQSATQQSATQGGVLPETDIGTTFYDRSKVKNGLSEDNISSTEQEEEVMPLLEDCYDVGMPLLSEDDLISFANWMLNDDDDSTARDQHDQQVLGFNTINLSFDEIDNHISHMPDEISFQNTCYSFEENATVKDDYEANGANFEDNDWDENSSVTSC
jgi:hypothetical protein